MLATVAAVLLSKRARKSVGHQRRRGGIVDERRRTCFAPRFARSVDGHLDRLRVDRHLRRCCADGDGEGEVLAYVTRPSGQEQVASE